MRFTSAAPSETHTPRTRPSEQESSVTPSTGPANLLLPRSSVVDTSRRAQVSFLQLTEQTGQIGQIDFAQSSGVTGSSSLFSGSLESPMSLAMG
jgi:hypothetical protein